MFPSLAKRSRSAIEASSLPRQTLAPLSGTGESSGERRRQRAGAPAPFGSFARGVAIFQPLISLNCGETIAAGRSKLGPTGAQPDSALAVTHAATHAWSWRDRRRR